MSEVVGRTYTKHPEGRPCATDSSGHVRYVCYEQTLGCRMKSAIVLGKVDKERGSH